jgi:hypothetical protein
MGQGGAYGEGVLVRVHQYILRKHSGNEARVLCDVLRAGAHTRQAEPIPTNVSLDRCLRCAQKWMSISPRLPAAQRTVKTFRHKYFVYKEAEITLRINVKDAQAP